MFYKLLILQSHHFHISSLYVDCLFFFLIIFLSVNEIKVFYSATRLHSFKTWDLSHVFSSDLRQLEYILGKTCIFLHPCVSRLPFS